MIARSNDVVFSHIFQLDNYPERSLGYAIVDARYLVKFGDNEGGNRGAYYINVIDTEIVTEQSEKQVSSIRLSRKITDVIALNNGKVAVIFPEYAINSYLTSFAESPGLGFETAEDKLQWKIACKRDQEFVLMHGYKGCVAGRVEIFDIHTKQFKPLAIGNNIASLFCLDNQQLISIHDRYADATDVEKTGQCIKRWDISDLTKPVCLSSHDIDFAQYGIDNHIKLVHEHNSKIYLFNAKNKELFVSAKKIIRLDLSNPSQLAVDELVANANNRFTDFKILKNGTIIVASLDGKIEFYDQDFKKFQTMIYQSIVDQPKLRLHLCAIADENYFMCWNSSSELKGEFEVWSVAEARCVEKSRLKMVYDISKNEVDAMTFENVKILNEKIGLVKSYQLGYKITFPFVGFVDFSRLKTLQLHQASKQPLTQTHFNFMQPLRESKSEIKEVRYHDGESENVVKFHFGSA